MVEGQLSRSGLRTATALSSENGKKCTKNMRPYRYSAARVHNLVRGVAPPYTGAFTELGGKPLRILRTRVEPGRMGRRDPLGLYAYQDACFAVCADGSTLRLLEMEYEGKPFTTRDFLARFGDKPVRLDRKSVV